MLKEQVVAKFKLEVLPMVTSKYGDNLEYKQVAWEVFLEGLVVANNISDNQGKTWVYPEKEIK